jgi:hypothetical protein
MTYISWQDTIFRYLLTRHFNYYMKPLSDYYPLLGREITSKLLYTSFYKTRLCWSKGMSTIPVVQRRDVNYDEFYYSSNRKLIALGHCIQQFPHHNNNVSCSMFLEINNWHNEASIYALPLDNDNQQCLIKLIHLPQQVWDVSYGGGNHCIASLDDGSPSIISWSSDHGKYDNDDVKITILGNDKPTVPKLELKPTRFIRSNWSSTTENCVEPKYIFHTTYHDDFVHVWDITRPEICLRHIPMFVDYDEILVNMCIPSETTTTTTRSDYVQATIITNRGRVISVDSRSPTSCSENEVNIIISPDHDPNLILSAADCYRHVIAVATQDYSGQNTFFQLFDNRKLSHKPMLQCEIPSTCNQLMCVKNPFSEGSLFDGLCVGYCDSNPRVSSICENDPYLFVMDPWNLSRECYYESMPLTPIYYCSLLDYRIHEFRVNSTHLVAKCSDKMTRTFRFNTKGFQYSFI